MDFLSLGAAALVPFALTCFIIELTPGPNMAYLAVVSASEGRKPGMATVAGIALGLAVVGAAASFGVAEFVAQSDTIYGVLRWAGVGFLLYLAYDAWRDGTAAAEPTGKAPSFYFRRGLITNLLNPKAALFFVTVLPTFIVPDRPLLPQNLMLATIYVGVATVVHTAIVLLASTLEPVLNSPSRERMVRRALALLLAAVAIWFGWTTRR